MGIKNINNDMVQHPTHYNKGIETIKYITSWEMDFLEGNIIKYVTRYKDKNGVEDLKKAKQYLEWLIEREKKEVMFYIGGRSFGKTRKLLEQKEKEIKELKERNKFLEEENQRNWKAIRQIKDEDKEIIKHYLVKKYLLLNDQKAPTLLLELIDNLIQELKNE